MDWSNDIGVGRATDGPRTTARVATNLTTSSACARCKTKKLKCDERLGSCSNCLRSNYVCMTVDAFSGRKYPRGYVDDLQARAAYLRAFIKEPQLQKQGLQPFRHRANPGSGATSVENNGGPSPNASYKFNGEGSVTGLGQIVANAVSHKSPRTQSTGLGDTFTRVQCNLEGIKANHANLPSLPDAQELVTSYLNGPHIIHPFLKRSDVYQQLGRLYASPLSTPKEPKDIFQINMVFAIGAVSLTRLGRHHTAPIDYYVTAMEQADAVLGLVKDEHIQNTLLIMLFGLHYDIVGNKWDFTRLAMRICIEKGYHRPPKTVVGPMVEQMQRRMFWCSYVSDRHNSSFLGRPVTISDADISVELPMDLGDDAIENASFSGPEPGVKSEVSILLRQIRLRKITSKTRTLLYSIKASNLSQSKEEFVQSLVKELEEWRDTSPLFLYPDSPYETSAYMDLQFQREKMSLFRRLALASKSELSLPGNQYLRYCLDAAAQLVTSYQALSSSDKLVMNWTCVHDMLSSGFMVLYCSIHLHRGSRSELDDCPSWMTDRSLILSTINACCEILQHISSFWKTVENHLALLRYLSSEVSKLIGDVPNRNGSSEHLQEPSGLSIALPSQFLDEAQGSAHQQDSIMWNALPGTLPAGYFSLSDADLNEILGTDFLDFNWGWNGTT